MCVYMCVYVFMSICVCMCMSIYVYRGVNMSKNKKVSIYVGIRASYGCGRVLRIGYMIEQDQGCIMKH